MERWPRLRERLARRFADRAGLSAPPFVPAGASYVAAIQSLPAEHKAALCGHLQAIVDSTTVL
ncbi:MAG: hypothetical protein FWF96_05650 [Kiritimatiellaeota bacterium]|nr:hypothetical protein [Kiritimatiellota bacterium]